MMKILRTADSDIVFTVIGRLEAENMADVRGLLAAEPPDRTVVLDLTDLVLIDRDAVRFLRTCERDGIVLRNCPPYIRAWMDREGEQH
jgi:hypothetical protein